MTLDLDVLDALAAAEAVSFAAAADVVANRNLSSVSKLRLEEPLGIRFHERTKPLSESTQMACVGS